MFDSDTQGFYKSEQQESSIMRRSFNPHALQRSAPLLHVGAVYHHEFQSTRPVWGAPQIVAISHEAFCVSIHAPRVGHDLYFSMIWIALSSFQSTRPVWGATVHLGIQGGYLRVSIHAPRVGRDRMLSIIRTLLRVSIHVPRVGRDFLFVGMVIISVVSIHAPRVGRDSAAPFLPLLLFSFNPRAPCGARHYSQPQG